MMPLRPGSWLITGGTGSFGHAFVRHLLNTNATRIVVFSRDELKQAVMAREFNDSRLRFLIGSVTDAERVSIAMRGIDYVVHAAAMKRIETCEQNPSEAVDTNIVGTQVVARCAIAAGVEKAIFLSTDKAAAPNTHYGATKLAAERLWVSANVYAAGTKTRLSATRYGNVIGSRGSVVPLFREQARQGEIKVTDLRMSRFWMQLSDAVDLVQLGFEQMRGGEIFIPKVGSSAVTSLAQAVAPNIPRTTTGIRRGEKLHETLVSEDEARDCYDCGTHYRIEPQRSWETPELPALQFPRVPEGFTYRSDNNPDQLSIARLQELVA